MPVAFWVGVKASFPAGGGEADAILDALGEALTRQGLPPYLEPEEAPAEGPLSRSRHFAGGIDDRAAREFHDVAFHPAFRLRGPRHLYLPGQFDDPLTVPVGAGRMVVGSHRMLEQALEDLAQVLDIPLSGGVVTEDVRRSITRREPLRPLADSAETVVCLRPVWLLYFQGLQLARAAQRALCVEL